MGYIDQGIRWTVDLEGPFLKPINVGKGIKESLPHKYHKLRMGESKVIIPIDGGNGGDTCQVVILPLQSVLIHLTPGLMNLSHQV